MHRERRHYKLCTGGRVQYGGRPPQKSSLYKNKTKQNTTKTQTNKQKPKQEKDFKQLRMRAGCVVEAWCDELQQNQRIEDASCGAKRGGAQVHLLFPRETSVFQNYLCPLSLFLRVTLSRKTYIWELASPGVNQFSHQHPPTLPWGVGLDT